jgi:ABC-type multidrug transport system fused ATPase/permease subunit
LSENLLYGKKDASNTAIVDAANIANATEFIESSDLSSAIEDTHIALNAEFTKIENEEVLMKALGENYPLFLEDMKKLAEKEVKEGSFQQVKGAVDRRTKAEKGEMAELPSGYDIAAGIRGSKLSGGQK